jgi:hypothetical protein
MPYRALAGWDEAKKQDISDEADRFLNQLD